MLNKAFKSKFSPTIAISIYFWLDYPDAVFATTLKVKVALVSFFISRIPSKIETIELNVATRGKLDEETKEYETIGQLNSS